MHLRLLFSVLVGGLVSATGTLHARVFETREQCASRYGRVVSSTPTPIGVSNTYQLNGVSVSIVFRGDKAVTVTYLKLPDKARPDENRAWTKDELSTLLGQAGGDRDWAPEQKDRHGRPYWKTKDGALNARVANELYLVVEDEAEFLRRSADTRPAPKPRVERDLSGF